MTKTPRPSIAEQLASIAATRPRDDVPPLTHDDVTHHETHEDHVVKARPRANDLANDAVLNEKTKSTRIKRGSADKPRGNLDTRPRDYVTPDGRKIRQRIEMPHASLYAPPAVFKKLREIAAAEDCKPHDLYIEGLRRVLEHYGYDFDKIALGKT